MTSEKRLLDNRAFFQRQDPQRMLDLLVEFPAQCEHAWALGNAFPLPRISSFRDILFLGMGGSAIGGDLAKSLLEEEVHCPIVVNRSYSLPAFVNKESIVFAVSYSGNTEETLAAYQAARRKKATLVVVASGGKLIEYAKEDGIPHLLIPTGLPPRTAMGYLFFVPYILLRKLRGLSLRHGEFREMVKGLEFLREKKIGPEVPFSRNLSKQIALRLVGKIPAIHGGVPRMEAVAMRWRTQIAENAKQLSWSHLYPELNHNEIVGWCEPKNLLRHLLILLLRDSGDHPRVKKRMDITQSLLRRESGVETLEVWSSGHSALERVLSLIYTGDFVSFYLAMFNHVDPTPVKRIERLKKQLAHR